MFRRTFLAALTLLALGGCASIPAEQRDPRDPLEPLNRLTFALNDAADRAIARPIARGYRSVAPQFFRTGVSNAFRNLEQPRVIVNGALQGKLRVAASATGRLLLNSTLGLGGLLDPATDAGLELYDEDFGQTLGRWGVRPGPYLVVPILGPSSFRDGLGEVVDRYADPSNYLEDDSTRFWIFVGDQIDRRTRLLDADAVLDRAGDRYAFVRSAYWQRREFQVSDGNMPEESPLEFEDDEDESGRGTESSSGSKPPPGTS